MQGLLLSAVLLMGLPSCDSLPGAEASPTLREAAAECAEADPFEERGPCIRDNVAPLLAPSGEDLADQPEMFTMPETNTPTYSFVDEELGECERVTYTYAPPLPADFDPANDTRNDYMVQIDGGEFECF